MYIFSVLVSILVRIVMGRKKTTTTFYPTVKGLEILSDPVNGNGGAQNIIKDVQSHFSLGEISVTVPEELGGRIVRLATNGSGGFQAKAKEIVGELRGS
jgi:hypothetical protein